MSDRGKQAKEDPRSVCPNARCGVYMIGERCWKCGYRRGDDNRRTALIFNGKRIINDRERKGLH